MALNDAVADLQRGRVDYAMVGGSSALFRPATTVAFHQLQCAHAPRPARPMRVLPGGARRPVGARSALPARPSRAGRLWRRRGGLRGRSERRAGERVADGAAQAGFRNTWWMLPAVRSDLGFCWRAQHGVPGRRVQVV